MKKNYLFNMIGLLAILLSTACSKEQNEKNIEESLNIEVIKYKFEGKTYLLEYKKEKEGEFTPLESDASNLIDQIIQENENLIFHDLNDSTIMLFKTDIDLNKYLNNNNLALTGITNRNDPYQCANLELYNDSYLNNNSRIHWWAESNIGSTNGFVGNLYCYPSQYCYFTSGSNVDRLKNLSITANWKTYASPPPAGCNFNSFIGYNPNDKISSVRVRNVFARFYEHANYSGRSITRDARYGTKVSEYRRLKSVRYRGRWDNRISSIKLSL